MEIECVFYLDRRRIVPMYNHNTPLIVLQDMAIGIETGEINPNTHDVTRYTRRFVKTLQQLPIYTFNPNSEDRDHLRSLLISYLRVDPTENLSFDELMMIYNFWEAVLLTLDKGSKENIKISRVGNPTRMFPYAFNASFLYRICLLSGVIIPENICLNTLGQIARFSIDGSSAITTCIDIIHNHLLSTSYQDVLSMVSRLPDTAFGEKKSNKPGFYPNHDDLLNIANKYRFKSVKDKRIIKPLNTREAIYLGIVNYGINLFLSFNPVMEYINFHKFVYSAYPDYYVPSIESNLIVSKIIDLTRYQPIDENIMKYLIYNPNLLTLNVFDSRIPYDIYPNYIIRQLSSERPYNNESDTVYESIQQWHIINTFHIGWYPEIKNNETPFDLEDLDGFQLVELCKSKSLICYGTFIDGLTGVTIKELTDIFKKNQTFQNFIPGHNDVFSDGVICHLKIICENINNIESRELLREIGIIEGIQQMNDSKFETLYNQYDEKKENIDKLFLLFLELSMYMRGWNGINSYPINGVVQFEAGEQGYIDIKVSEAIQRLEDYCLNLGELGDLFLTLPIMKYYNHRFILSTNSDEGYTIRQRLHIIKNSDSDEGYNSCIRLSSNWFSATAYRYYQILRLPLPFEISQLNVIS